MKRKLGILVVASVLLAHLPLGAVERVQGTRILASTGQSIQIEVTPKYRQPNTIRFNGREFVDYDFEGSLHLATSAEVGVPDLRYQLLPLAFQASEGNDLQVIAAEYEEIPNVALVPTPTWELQGDMLVIKDYVINNERYSKNEFLPGKTAELSPVVPSRSMLIGSVRLFPLQYNPVTKTLRRYSRIVVQVNYAPSGAARIQNNDDELYATVLLNANVARTWKFARPQAFNRLTAVPSVLASGTWYRLTVTDEGMYKLDANWFSSNGINLSGVNPRTIKIYGNGGRELPENILAERPVDLVENAISVEGEADGRFDASDYVLFYGRGVQGIKYDPNGQSHYIHHYARENYYWLTFGGADGKRMATQASVAGATPLVATKFTDVVWVEPDTFNLLRSGKNWLSAPIGNNGTYLRTLTLNGLIPGEPRLYRFAIAAVASSSSSFDVLEGQTALGNFPAYATSLAFSATDNSALQNNTSKVMFKFRSSDVGASGFLDWVEVAYPRTFDAVGNMLRFRSSGSDTVVEYRLNQFSSAPMIFNVTDYANVRRIADAGGTFRARELGGVYSEYLAVGNGAFRAPSGVVRVANQNLRGNTQQYDFIIITSSEFASAANRLKAHRENPAYGGLKTIVVDVQQIYNEFSGGVPDITAIRDFLKYTYDFWPPNPPKFVCFFGQGSYDYKGILGSRSSYVPTWQTEDSFGDVSSSATDDFFIRFGSGAGWAVPYMVSGRLNARSTRQAEQIVDRIINYDTRSARDAWRFRALYVGDDAHEEGNIYTEGAEILANLTPDLFEKIKVYEEEYPEVNTAQGRRRPSANVAIIDAINRGVLITNYTGHGNPTVWAHESVFSTQASVPLLFNANKLSYFFAATCSFSQFDDPARETASELLINRAEGGAIAVISAARKVYDRPNQDLNRGIYRNMFRYDSIGRVNVERVATAMFLYKTTNINGDVANDEKFLVLGDPTLQLQFPRGFVVVDSINGRPADGPQLIQLKSLSRITVKGSVRTDANRIDSTAAGRLTLIVNDATRSVLIPSVNWSYSAVGSLIYRGENSVSNGRFSATFIVPKDIAYADSNARGRVVTYFASSSSTNDGVGYTSNVNVGGTDPSAAVDTIGPSMRIMLGNSYETGLAFRPGDVLNEKPVLYVDLVDSNGINTSTSGVGHRIEAWINGSAQSKDLTDFYVSKLDNFRAGTVQYPLSDLPQGRNTIKVRAWDTYNNSRTDETYFQVMSSDQLRVVDVMNYPNPFTKTTAFTFRHNQLVPVNATVKVYTVAGRLVQTVEKFAAGNPFVTIPWDGRDRDGDELANGVYLYKLIVRTVDGRFGSEVLGKLAIAR